MSRARVHRDFPPHWHVAEQLDTADRPLTKTDRWIVIDTSVEPPRQVHGPSDQQAAETFAHLHWLTFHTLRGTFLIDSVSD